MLAYVQWNRFVGVHIALLVCTNVQDDLFFYLKSLVLSVRYLVLLLFCVNKQNNLFCFVFHLSVFKVLHFLRSIIDLKKLLVMEVVFSNVEYLLEILMRGSCFIPTGNV